MYYIQRNLIYIYFFSETIISFYISLGVFYYSFFVKSISSINQTRPYSRLLINPINFNCFQYLGCVEVFESRGMQVCEEALKVLRVSEIKIPLKLSIRYFQFARVINFLIYTLVDIFFLFPKKKNILRERNLKSTRSFFQNEILVELEEAAGTCSAARIRRRFAGG